MPETRICVQGVNWRDSFRRSLWERKSRIRVGQEKIHRERCGFRGKRSLSLWVVLEWLITPKMLPPRVLFPLPYISLSVGTGSSCLSGRDGSAYYSSTPTSTLTLGPSPARVGPFSQVLRKIEIWSIYQEIPTPSGRCFTKLGTVHEALALKRHRIRHLKLEELFDK